MKEDFQTNAIKSHLRNTLNLKTLDALMRVSICGLVVYAMDWGTIFNIWRDIQEEYFRLINNIYIYYFFWLQIKIAYWFFKFTFPKILCKPKLR